MPSMLLYLAPVALLLPIGSSGELVAAWHGEEGKPEFPDVKPSNRSGEEFQPAARSGTEFAPAIGYQVRIERRVTVRVAPRRTAPRQNLTAELAEAPEAPIRYEEGETTDCVEISSVSGVQTGSGNRLLFYLRDQRMISARLEKSCRARDFYSGFYVERGEDGKICINRDKLQSRAGAKCELERMRELTPVYN